MPVGAVITGVAEFGEVFANGPRGSNGLVLVGMWKTGGVDARLKAMPIGIDGSVARYEVPENSVGARYVISEKPCRCRVFVSGRSKSGSARVKTNRITRKVRD